MANSGKDTMSQFFITLAPTPWLDGKYTIFGRVSKHIQTLEKIGLVKVGKNDRPVEEVNFECRGDDTESNGISSLLCCLLLIVHHTLESSGVQNYYNVSVSLRQIVVLLLLFSSSSSHHHHQSAFQRKRWIRQFHRLKHASVSLELSALSSSQSSRLFLVPSQKLVTNQTLLEFANASISIKSA